MQAIANHCSLVHSLVPASGVAGSPSRHSRGHFHLSVLQTRLALGGESSSLHWVDDGARRRVGDRNTFREVLGSTCPIGCEIESIPVGQGAGPYHVRGKGGYDVEGIVLNIGVV